MRNILRKINFDQRKISLLVVILASLSLIGCDNESHIPSGKIDLPIINHTPSPKPDTRYCDNESHIPSGKIDLPITNHTPSPKPDTRYGIGELESQIKLYENYVNGLKRNYFEEVEKDFPIFGRLPLDLYEKQKVLNDLYRQRDRLNNIPNKLVKLDGEIKDKYDIRSEIEELEREISRTEKYCEFWKKQANKAANDGFLSSSFLVLSQTREELYSLQVKRQRLLNIELQLQTW